MKRTAKKILSLGLAAALVIAGAAYGTSIADAKGKGNGNEGKNSWNQEKQKDSKEKKVWQLWGRRKKECKLMKNYLQK